MNKQYIVTGCAGFIGSHMTERLLAEGHKVVGIDNLSSGKEENMKNFLKNKNFQPLCLDISNNAFSELFKTIVNSLVTRRDNDFNNRFDGVFHFAAKARIQPSIQEPVKTHQNNVQGTLNLLEIMRELGVSNIVYSASSSAYGLNVKLPCKEDSLPDCLNPYALTKYVGEQYCKVWGKTYGINNVCLKYFNVYGERSPLDHQAYAPVIGLFFRQGIRDGVLTIVGDGEQRRDFTYVSDVVQANLNAMSNISDVSGETFNVGTGKNYSINEVAEMVMNALADRGVQTTSKHIPPRPAEARETLASYEKLNSAFDWHPETLLEDKIERLCEYYLKTIE